jgi:Double zinc ribbon
MDDLDRLFRRLVQNVHSSYPDYMTRPFRVSELYQHIIPYRNNRGEMGIEMNGDYEVALMRLLSGERGYLSGDGVMQASMRDELATSNPDTTAFRLHATAMVALAPEAVRRLDQYLSGRETKGTPRDSRAIAPGGAGGGGGARPSAAVAAAAPRASAGVPQPARPLTPSDAPLIAARRSVGGEDAANIVAGGTVDDNTAECRYCAGALPTGRKVVFCPHCGQNLSVQHCPACSTELELGWKFCTTCGRRVASA